ncbi:MAG: hypothetical protein IPI01_18120 [Ignavibacteriae bacterium]|nr:hypothetical protein [Ignavibacteriota bacterium]
MYVKDADGVYEPSNLVWPSYWAFATDTAVVPVLPDRVKPLIAALHEGDSTYVPGRWPRFTSDEVAKVLRGLSAMDSRAGDPVYISGGRVFRMSSEGRLLSRDGDAAQPYLWPIAHDVRPKDQSLGARGCDDCHAPGGPFFAGTVLSMSPFFAGDDTTASMTAFQDQGPVYPWLLHLLLFPSGAQGVHHPRIPHHRGGRAAAYHARDRVRCTRVRQGRCAMTFAIISILVAVTVKGLIARDARRRFGSWVRRAAGHHHRGTFGIHYR